MIVLNHKAVWVVLQIIMPSTELVLKQFGCLVTGYCRYLRERRKRKVG